MGDRPRYRSDLEESPVSASRLSRGDQTIQDVGFVSPRREDGKRMPAVRHDQPLACPHATQVAAQILTKLTNTDTVTHNPEM